MAQFQDLTGQKFGRLYVLERAADHILPSGKPKTMWLCKCDCGTIKAVSGQSLRQNTTLSCGCQHKETFKKPIKDMSNQRFGKLLVVKYDHTLITDTGQHKIYWLCQCDCGNTAVVEGYQLRSGKTQSCGCTKSRGEELIATMLNSYNVDFKQNKRLKDFRTDKGSYPLFDFQLFREDKLIACIEMQGIQHYENENPMPDFGKYEREVTDQLKRKYCKDHDIPLFEIKYTEDIANKTKEIVEALYANTVPRQDDIL